MRQEIRRYVPAEDVKRVIGDFRDARNIHTVDCNPTLVGGEPEDGQAYTVTATFND